MSLSRADAIALHTREPGAADRIMLHPQQCHGGVR